MEFFGIDSNGWVAIATFIIAIATFIAALIASKNSSRIFQQSNKDEWLKTYQTHYFEFWHDKEMRDIRSAIVNNDAYSSLKEILIKRLETPGKISKEEYRELDKLDKFLNIITLIRQINPLLGTGDDVWEELFLEYWLISPKKENREELLRYIELCYKSSYHVIMEKEWQRKKDAKTI